MVARTLVLATLSTACSSSPYPSADELDPPVSSHEPTGESSADSIAAHSTVRTPRASAAGVDSSEVIVRDDLDGRPIDRRVLGTNVPAWLGPDLLSDPAFQAATVASGTTLLRMPGGSWSNSYDWLHCEYADSSGCYWTWAARPTDFVDFMQATGLPGMWTVSINETAKSAAAAVAFFNGSVGDLRAIGVDRDGVDWGTVDTWARLRAAHGNPEPAPINLWEVGNEVFGGRPESGGPECAAFGWEDVWTCSGTTYVTGDDTHDGYLAIRAAMIAVDPSIEVGAVGVADPGSWSDWGNEVIQAAGEQLDFYVVHQYGFDSAPEPRDALSRPTEMWPGVIDAVRSSLPQDVPIAVTEYNLVAIESGDTDRSMTRAVNGLYLADSIGQLVSGGVAIANQWNLANGTTTSGTDYGMISVDDLSTFPQYEAMALWGATGETLLAMEGAAPEGVRIYPTRRDDGARAVVMINLNDSTATFDIRFGGLAAGSRGTLTALHAERLEADAWIEDAPVVVQVGEGGAVSLSLPAWSLGLLEVAGGA